MLAGLKLCPGVKQRWQPLQTVVAQIESGMVSEQKEDLSQILFLLNLTEI